MSFDLSKRSKVINLCPWPVSFALLNGAEIVIDAKKTNTINNEELVALADNSNIMFVGTGNGDHARIYVDNPDYRLHVGFDVEADGAVEKRTQFVLTDEECEKLVSLKTDSAFKQNVQKKVILHHEKAILLDYCRKHKVDSYTRIKFLEEYTGLKF